MTIAMSGCSGGLFGPDPPPERNGEPIQTDQTRYRAIWLRGSDNFREYGFTLTAVFTNLSDRTVYVDRCFPNSPTPMYGVLSVGDSDPFGVGYNGVWACVGHDQQFVVASGETRTDTFQISGPNAWDGRTGVPFGSLEGRFRLTYRVQFCPEQCDDEAPETVLSNSFDVGVER